MQSIGLVADPVFEEHDTGPGHPETPSRLARIRAMLEASGLGQRAVRVEPESASDETLARVHDLEHIRRVDATHDSGAHFLDSMDVAVSPATARVARLAAGSLVALCRKEPWPRVTTR